MNAVDLKPNYRKIYGIARERFGKTTHFKHGPYDETYYTLLVYESAKEIIRKLNRPVRVQQVLVASLLHDIGKTRLRASRMFARDHVLDNVKEEWHRHELLGGPVARSILKKLGHSNAFVDEVVYLVENHANRGGKLKDKSIELQVLQDADLVADCGFASFIRPFLFCGKFSRHNVIDSIKFIQKEENRVNKKHLLNLAVSRQIAKKKVALQERLVSEISKDIKSDLI